MICMKNLRFSSRPRAKVKCQRPPGFARAQPCMSLVLVHFYRFQCLTGCLKALPHNIPLPKQLIKKLKGTTTTFSLLLLSYYSFSCLIRCKFLQIYFQKSRQMFSKEFCQSLKVWHCGLTNGVFRSFGLNSAGFAESCSWILRNIITKQTYSIKPCIFQWKNISKVVNIKNAFMSRNAHKYENVPITPN